MVNGLPGGLIVARALSDLGPACARPVVALGKFDGVHRGHAKLLAAVRRLAARVGAPSMAVTFDVHPDALLRPHQVPPVLTTIEEKTAAIAASGVDCLLYLEFTAAFARLSAWEFARDFLAGGVGARMVLAGENFRFGRNRGGDTEMLRRWGPRLGFGFRAVSQATVGGEPVSSTRIRRVIAAGEMRLAAALLGRPYSLEGEVDHGVNRGRALGAPTANLRLPRKLLPPDGVYLAQASIDGGAPLPALLNLGTSPTFGAGERRLEAHFLRFSGDLYGHRVRVFFERYLRHETRFPDAASLARQIRLDVARAERHFGFGR
ncbi:MAG TPA: riboflavin biosynthesis protein RibF [Candidatus Methanoperedens sp.]|nr:riboflavin biosynthesis protein RibF [Candidatus Methanoperedens sp.]